MQQLKIGRSEKKLTYWRPTVTFGKLVKLYDRSIRGNFQFVDYQIQLGKSNRSDKAKQRDKLAVAIQTSRYAVHPRNENVTFST